jgi:alpha-L-arabinofuranosidase
MNQQEVIALDNQADAGGPGDEYKGIDLKKDKVLTAQILPVEIAVRENRTLKNYSGNMFGFNYDWLGVDALKIAELRNNNRALPLISKQYIRAMQGFPQSLCRMAGTNSQHFHWKQAIGPIELRKEQKLAPWAKSKIQTTGLLEWIKSCRKVDKDAQFVWVVNISRDTPQDAADLAEFLTRDANTQWGNKSIEYGLKAPVKPAIWELGNELDWSHEKMPVDEYIQRCREVMTAIRKIQPDAVFAAHTKTAPWSRASKETWQEWHQAVLKYLANDLQYIVFHPYYHGHKIVYLEQFISRIESDINKSDNPDIKLFMSEHAKWRPHCDEDPKKYWYQTHALVGCLDTAEWLLRMLDRPKVTAMTYHSHSSGPWGMIYRDEKSDRLFTTGIADLFKLFSNLPGRKVVKCNISGPYTDVKKDDLSFTAAAVTGPDNKLFLILNNRLPNTSRKVTFKFQNQYHLKKVQTLSAPDLHSYNTVDHKVIKVEAEDIDSNAHFANFKVPPKSLTFLELQDA